MFEKLKVQKLKVRINGHNKMLKQNKFKSESLNRLVKREDVDFWFHLGENYKHLLIIILL